MGLIERAVAGERNLVLLPKPERQHLVHHDRGGLPLVGGNAGIEMGVGRLQHGLPDPRPGGHRFRRASRIASATAATPISAAEPTARFTPLDRPGLRAAS